jgi:hypothetical protein
MLLNENTALHSMLGSSRSGRLCMVNVVTCSTPLFSKPLSALQAELGTPRPGHIAQCANV